MTTGYQCFLGLPSVSRVKTLSDPENSDFFKKSIVEEYCGRVRSKFGVLAAMTIACEHA